MSINYTINSNILKTINLFILTNNLYSTEEKQPSPSDYRYSYTVRSSVETSRIANPKNLKATNEVKIESYADITTVVNKETWNHSTFCELQSVSVPSINHESIKTHTKKPPGSSRRQS